jgi:ATP-dependent helicase/nuclease subunit B
MTAVRGLWGIDPGADFAANLVAGLTERLANASPEALARVRVIVPTRPLQRRIVEAFEAGPARLLPRVEVLDDLADDPVLALPPAEPPLTRHLTLARLVGALIASSPGIAPPSAVFDLAQSLAALMDEMQAEGVPPERLADLDVADMAAHWQASLRFLSIISAALDAGMTGPEGRLHTAVSRITAGWAATPAPDPIIVAGSTGSRGPARALMLAVAALPQGALVFPGFDFDLPSPAWASLTDALTAEDHPQFRFARVLSDLGADPATVRRWHGAPLDAARGRLLSLALRPAPVTDQWLSEGPGLGDPSEATEDLTLIEAPDPRAEAAAIACAMRIALEQSLSATLVTPDRTLARRVTAVLDGWQLRPDDSAGRPLSQTAPGRFLRHTAALFHERLTAEALAVLLKHPLTHSGADRGPHLLCTRDLELRLRGKGPPYPDAASLAAWAGRDHVPVHATAWAEWLGKALPPAPDSTDLPLADHLVRHRAFAEALAAGPSGSPSELWATETGQRAAEAMDALATAAPTAAAMSPRDYARLLDQVLSGVNVRDDTPAHPFLRIRGPREARGEVADLMILAGLNEGTWPAPPSPDPWMSRSMRHAAGLLLPERQIGLSAHDFQIAAGAARVILSRARRDDAAETVPARWLNRLTNLMTGLPGGWDQALSAMRARGQRWLDLGATLSLPHATVPSEARPAPAPVPAQRPAQLSITQIQTLIRDPYAIYARHILRLRPLEPLTKAPDPRDRGTILHSILEALVTDGAFDEAEFAESLLSDAAVRLSSEVPWPAARRLWLARLAGVARDFASAESLRRDLGTPLKKEGPARLQLDEIGFTLTGVVDRVDAGRDGGYLVYDYKSGAPPTPSMQRHFDRQLALSALCVSLGAVKDVPPAPVIAASFLSLAAGARAVSADPDDLDPSATRAALIRLLSSWADPDRGYVSRRAVRTMMDGSGGDFDHLARFGEWAQTDDAPVRKVGP